MSSRRVLKAAQAIREVVGMAVIKDLKDPRIRDVTVTFVEVSADLRNAKVHVSVMGDDNKKKLCLKGLESACGFIQKKVGDRVDTRYTPRLKFVLDKGLDHSMLVTRILEEVLPAEEETQPEETESEEADVTESNSQLEADSDVDSITEFDSETEKNLPLD